MKFSRLLVSLLGFLPRSVIKPIAFKYVAGEDSSAALQKTKELNAQQVKATIDILGESVHTADDATAFTEQYIALIQEIAQRRLSSGVSVKPTAVGLCVSHELALANFTRLVEAARPHDVFIRIDMEDSRHTDNTIRLYKELKRGYDRIGIVYQAYLRRTLEDIRGHEDNNFNVRICKGIYREAPDIAYQSYQAVADNYRSCLELLFAKGAYTAIATHDEALVRAAQAMITDKQVPADKYEFQMLYGVLPDLRDRIRSDGHPMRVYIPYGKDWYPYSIRRMYENPQIAFYVAKAVFVDSFLFLFRKLFR